MAFTVTVLIGAACLGLLCAFGAARDRDRRSAVQFAGLTIVCLLLAAALAALMVTQEERP